MSLTRVVCASSEYLLVLNSLFIIYVEEESVILAEALLTFKEIQPVSVALFKFNFLII